MTRKSKTANNTMVVINEKSHCLKTIYKAARHSLSVESKSFLILYIMPTMSFHYWNLIRKQAEESSQNQIQAMLNDIKNKVFKNTRVRSDTMLEMGNMGDIVKGKLLAHRINWLWMSMDLGQEYVNRIIHSLQNASKKQPNIQVILTFNKNKESEK